MKFSHSPLAPTKIRPNYRAIAALALLFGTMWLLPTALRAQGTLTTIHTFTLAEQYNGISPNPLIQGNDGNFYGTCVTGGGGYGEIFKITPAGELTVLHSFKGGTDGSYPSRALVQDEAGNLYGSTSGDFGSSRSQVPTIFKLATDGTLTTLHTFAYETTYSGASAALLRESDGSLYGTTYGNDNDADGTIFKLAPDGTFTTLHNFGGVGSIAVYSLGTPVRGSDGALYGTTYNGDAYNSGTVYKLAPDGTFTTLHTFATSGGYPDANGVHPLTGLVLGQDDNFYGTTSSSSSGTGTVFRITSTGEFTKLHSFDSAQGAAPTSLVKGNDGYIYGTSKSDPSAYSSRGIFRVDPDGAVAVLYTGTVGPIIQAADGDFYGSIPNDGVVLGTVFRLAVPHSAAGSVDFTTSLHDIMPGDDVTLKIGRHGGSQGAVSVSYSMVRGDPPYTGATPAVADVDYVATSGTLSWGDGDTTDKVVTVKTLAPQFNQFDSVKYFSVALGSPTNGALLGFVPVSRVTIDHVVSVTSPRTADARVGAPFSYAITTNFYQTPYSYSAAGLPAGLSLDPASGVISGAPTTAGVYLVALSAATVTGDSKATLTITVASAPPPGAPVLTGPTNTTAMVGSPFTYHLTSSDAAALVVVVDGLPPGLNFDPATGTLAGTPAQAGAFVVTFNSTNAGGTGSLTLALTVAALPLAPSVTAAATVPSAQFGGGTYGQFTLTLSSAQANDLHVAYSVKGTGLNGTDYVLLKGKAKLKGGKTTKAIKVVPLGDGRGLSKRTVKFTLLPGDGYTVGTDVPLKVKLLAPTP